MEYEARGKFGRPWATSDLLAPWVRSRPPWRVIPQRTHRWLMKQLFYNILDTVERMLFFHDLNILRKKSRNRSKINKCYTYYAVLIFAHFRIKIERSEWKLKLTGKWMLWFLLSQCFSPSFDINRSSKKLSGDLLGFIYNELLALQWEEAKLLDASW